MKGREKRSDFDKQMKLMTASVCLVKTGRRRGVGCRVKHSLTC